MAFVIVSLAWGYIIPAYNRMIASAASPIFRLVERDNVTAVRADGSRLLIGRHTDDGTIQPFLYFDPYIYFGIIPLIAILVAIPGPGIFLKLRRTLIGIAILFIVHVIYLIGSIELTYVALGLHPVGAISKRILDWTQILLRILWQVSPVLIAVLLSMRFWRDRFLSMRTAAAPSGSPINRKLAPTERLEGERL